MSLLEYREYEEADVTFLPTYRFVNGHFDPDHSGWPDRIWYSANSKIQCENYSTVEDLRHSHVPVVGRYKVEVKRVN